MLKINAVFVTVDDKIKNGISSSYVYKLHQNVEAFSSTVFSIKNLQLVRNFKLFPMKFDSTITVKI